MTKAQHRMELGAFVDSRGGGRDVSDRDIFVTISLWTQAHRGKIASNGREKTYKSSNRLEVALFVGFVLGGVVRRVHDGDGFVCRKMDRKGYGSVEGW